MNEREEKAASLSLSLLPFTKHYNLCYVRYLMIIILRLYMPSKLFTD